MAVFNARKDDPYKDYPPAPVNSCDICNVNRKTTILYGGLADDGYTIHYDVCDKCLFNPYGLKKNKS